MPSNIGDFQHLPRFRSIHEALKMQIFAFLQLMWCQEQSGLSDSRTFQSQGRGLNRKKTWEKHEILSFKPLLQAIQLKNLTIRKIFWSANIWALKKNTCCQSLQKQRNWIILTPYVLSKNLWQIILRENHMKFMRKKKVNKTTWAKKLCGLIGQKWQNSFHWTRTENLFVSFRRASTWPVVLFCQIFRYFPAFQVVIVEYSVLFILVKCLMDSQQVLLIFTEVWP